jgi:hypothetical protein
MDSKIEEKFVKCHCCKKIVSIYIVHVYDDFYYCDECYDLWISV